MYLFQEGAAFCCRARAMEESMPMRDEHCRHCSGPFEGANFCTACGRQVNPFPQARVACRAAEGSAEKAWKSFGFADACTSSKRPRAAMTGLDSVERASTQALAATRSMIESTVAPPTLEQAHVIGVESMVEGVEWNLSTQQLQVLSLARSGALQGRRKVQAGALEMSSPGAAEVAIAKKIVSSKRSTRKLKKRSGRAAGSTSRRQPGKRSTGDTQEVARSRQQEIGAVRRVSEQTYSDDALTRPKLAEASVSTEKDKTFPPNKRHTDGANTPLRSLGQHRHRREREETQEQIVALARGGVRHLGKVFHRKGVKLTEDSPRSMLPRDAFRAAGPHLLGEECLSMGQPERSPLLVAKLSAIVRAVSPDAGSSKKGSPISGLRGAASLETRSLDGLETAAGVHQAETLYVCDGVRLEVGPRPSARDSLPGLDARVISATTATNPSDLDKKLPEEDEFSKSRSATYNRDSALDGDDGAPLGGEDQESGDDAIAERKPQEDAPHALESVQQAPPSPSSIVNRLACLDKDYPAVSANETRHSYCGSLIFSQDLTHVEVGALLGPKLSWKDPFQEKSRTVGELKATSWATCLHLLCGRLRVSVPPMDNQGDRTNGGRLSVEGEKLKTAQTAAPAGAKPLERSPGVTEESFANAEDPQPLLQRSPPSTLPTKQQQQQQLQQQQQQQQCAQKELSTNAAAKKQELPVDNIGGVRRVENLSCDEPHGRIVQAIPLLRKGQAESKAEGEAEEHVWLDTTMMRVGVRVPWGRFHGGRFAKVLFTVRIGENGRGLNFSALSVSPTADPMLRGCWESKATDRDLARFLSSGSWNTSTGSSRRGRPYSYDSHRCVGELQERGELSLACVAIVRKAFRLVLVVPGGVVLSLAGVAVAGGREVAWPQDIEEDKVLARASTDLQRSWRGFISRKYTRWLRVEREGRRRLSRMRDDIEAERERVRGLEQEVKAKLMLEETRQKRAQQMVARAAARWLARREASRQRAEQETRPSQVERDTDDAERRETTEQAEAPRLSLQAPDDTSRAEEVASSGPEGDDATRIARSGAARLDRVVTIDGTEVHLTAHVQGMVTDDDGNGVVGTDADDGKPMEMLIVAVDQKGRRSSRLSLDAAEVAEIVCSSHGGGGGDMGAGKAKGVHAALSAVLQKLTLFNSRRKDLFILSYKGKRVVAPH